MKALRTAGLACMLVVMSACASMGSGVTADTFNQKLEGAYRSAESEYTLISTLVNGHVISGQKARSFIAKVDLQQQAVAAAVTLHATDPAGGDAKLQAAIIALQLLQAELASQSGEPSP